MVPQHKLMSAAIWPPVCYQKVSGDENIYSLRDDCLLGMFLVSIA